jgi:hypothetical protein
MRSADEVYVVPCVLVDLEDAMVDTTDCVIVKVEDDVHRRITDNIVDPCAYRPRYIGQSVRVVLLAKCRPLLSSVTRYVRRCAPPEGILMV